ncbi:transporter [Planctomycetota bacterium]
MISHRLLRNLLSLLVVLTCISLPAQAFDQPVVNLGLTSFVDGGPPAGPGFYYAGYLQYYSADRLVDHPLDQTANLDVLSYANQFLYQSDQPLLFGGKWGVDVILPIVNLNSDSTSVLITETPTGLGDLLVGPYLQWDPIMGENGPVFMHRVELQMILPTGKYDQNKALNPGSNFFSFNPYWSGTWFIMPRWTASCRIHYLWNDKNKDPWTVGGLDKTQAGQAWHMNFASAYEVVEKKIRVGINGYYFRQITDSKNTTTAGVTTSATGYEQVLGVGPGAVFHFGQDNHLFCNLYFENNASYRPDGTRGILRWVHHF